MFGDYFLDQCVVACSVLNNKDLEHREVFSAIHEIATWYRGEVSRDDASKESKNKLDFVFYISNFRLNNKAFSISEFVENIKTGKFSELVSTLESSADKELTDVEISDIKTKVLNKLKICRLMDGKRNLELFLETVDTENYVDECDIIDKWEYTLSGLYTNYMKIKTSESTRDAGYLDLLNDSYDSVIDKIRDTTNIVNTIKTGYTFIDNNLTSSGLEERRLYLIGGESGVGKSTLLINIVCNEILSRAKLKDVDKSENKTILYVTAENLIDESLLRFYCCLTGQDINTIIENIHTDECAEALKNDIKDVLIKSNCNVIFKYIPKGTPCKDLDLMLECVDQIENSKFHLFVLDYLDLIKSGELIGSDNLRLDLGEVAKWLKNCSVNYSVPVLTATQLNRSGYDSKSAPALTQMGESMHKVNESDFILFLQRSEELTSVTGSGDGTKEYTVLRSSILKNRNGSVGATSELKMCTSVGTMRKKFFNFRIEEPVTLDNTINGQIGFGKMADDLEAGFDPGFTDTTEYVDTVKPCNSIITSTNNMEIVEVTPVKEDGVFWM